LIALDQLRSADYSLPVTGARFAQPAPEFSLPSTLGRPISLAEYRGRADVVLAFYCYDFGSI
jgi:peroxiredoxin